MQCADKTFSLVDHVSREYFSTPNHHGSALCVCRGEECFSYQQDDIIKKYFCVNQKENISKNVAESCEYMIDKLSMYKEPEIKYVRDIFAATEKFYKSGESVFYYYVLSQ